MRFDNFKLVLRGLCAEVENLSIENLVYFMIISENRLLPLTELEKRVAEALVDPARRLEAHRMHQGLWQALEDAGSDAFYDHLDIGDLQDGKIH
jgi:hypothetical protein